MSDEDVYINRDPSEGDLFRQPSLSDAIRNIQRARAAAGLMPQAGRQLRTEQMIGHVADIAVVSATENRDYYINLMNQISGAEASQQAGVHSAYRNIVNLIASLGGSIESQRTEIKEISQLLDTDNNGVVSNAEVANAANNGNTMNQINIINPLIAKLMKDPNMSVRKIPRMPVENPVGSKKSMSNNVNLVRQAYAGYVDDVNMFNVDFDTQF